MKKQYSIGLDIGTNSVGWAVTSDNHDLIRRRMKINGDYDKGSMKKNFWGVRLFDEGVTAEERRVTRTTRRRLRRRKNRLHYLQSFFMDEMKKVDENFFYRLTESFIVPMDKDHDRHPVFGTMEEEVAYHKQFPTIYHLRKYLADSNEQADLRLVYLALAHIIKFRGHFLIDGELSTEHASNDAVGETFKAFLHHYNHAFHLQPDEAYINLIPEDLSVEAELTAKVSKSRKAESVLHKVETEKSNGTFHQFLKLIVGNQGNFKKTFSLDEDRKLDIGKEEYEEDVEALLEEIGEDYRELFLSAKHVHDAIELSGILEGADARSKAPLSSSMIARYDNHKQDLHALKTLVKAQLPDRYFDIFRNSAKDGYAGYIEGKTSEEDFYKFLKKVLNKVDGAESFIKKIDEERFLRKQRTYDNGVIPHQIHLHELKTIIEKQGQYYAFLLENKEKIASLLTFRIPYYVGPLAKGQSKFAWIEREGHEAVRPWNIKEEVNLVSSAEKFIEKMTNDDTYLPEQKVLPKHSLLLQKFNVFNELTKVQYLDSQGQRRNFSGKEKQEIYHNLFKSEKNRTVSIITFEEYLKNEYQLDNPKVQGIEKKFNASLKTYHDFLKLGMSRDVLDNELYAERLEDLVKILTVFEDREMIRKQLESFSDLFDQAILKKLERRHYTGWGRLSAKLIHGIKDERTQKTILDYLIEDDRPKNNINRNFMQLINDDDLSFKKTIEEMRLKLESNNLKDAVDKIPGSPAIKKGILQSLKIVDEIVEIMGYEPESIVIEMARENQTTSQGQRNAKERLNNIEGALKELKSDLLKKYPVDQEALKNDRLYLYYLQNGKDMYTNQELDINKLSNYDIDHIIPRSFTTDNSIDNRVLVSSKLNRGKSNDVPSEEVVRNMKSFWSLLYRSKLISKRKFDNLTKLKLTDDDKAGFIRRQLVETRQITKHVASILHQRYNNPELDEPAVKIVTLKSALTSQFRQAFDLYKVREINDYHHAHDAYLNAVVARLLMSVYPQLIPDFVYGEYRKTSAFKENKATAKKQFYTNLIERFSKEDKLPDDNGEIAWDKSRDLAKINRVLNYHQMNIVKKVEVQTGNFSKVTVLQKGTSNKLIPRKKDWDPKKYGGFDSPNVAYSIIFTHEKGKQKKVMKDIIGITIMDQQLFEADQIKYLENKGYSNPKINFKLAKYTVFELENNRRRLLASANEAQKGNQMVLPSHLVLLLYHCRRYIDSSFKNANHETYILENKEKFNELLDYVLQFSRQYTLAEVNDRKISAVFEGAFNQAEASDLATSFINLMDYNKMGAPSAFTFFETKIDRKRYTSLKELLNAKIIYQSVTGLYETRKEV
ncbi:CRISPR-associated endonuclease Cas9 [Halolactibacillus alkaliphilus]|uniref:CRISPR-associated endonuclease Cas9 n=1 Tax=Halolactibacillus alkaliphilus TaxID=442899 RepID=A0A511WZR8_9BACI|nr:type II CRISPR RNA-guided endonuclease Cas9 [Halolactibacillus alkaliphilus]GEN56193.1 CRISPR-associated endonuclease Cas9 [Halolactibacillus alkaliphilus]GGN66638.1 CRISPR-associated endonuclease Cas9 [Halolactibacillus alkaliphilus]SFO68080.1 CRISPR-associated endonuclease, Csn1 family [Halolactibacillus alkaliphilus]